MTVATFECICTHVFPLFVPQVIPIPGETVTEIHAIPFPTSSSDGADYIVLQRLFTIPDQPFFVATMGMLARCKNVAAVFFCVCFLLLCVSNVGECHINHVRDNAAVLDV